MGIPITGTFIRGAGDIGQFAIAKADALLIPIQNVADSTARTALVEYLRTPYMVVYEIATGDTYRLGSDVTIGGQIWTLETGNYILVTDKGAANGVAPLDANSKIPNQYLNQLVLSQVHAVADLAEMFALTAFEGNLVIVADASADPAVSSGSAVYVKLDDVGPTTTLTNFLIVEFGASVTSVNGDTGVVSVDFASMIGETGSQTAFDAAVVANATVAANAAAIIVNAAAIVTLGTDKADVVDVLTRTNTDVYAPTADYHPSTKLYVDTAVSGLSSTPGGNTTEIQFNLAGVFAGDASLTFASSILTVPNLLIGSVPDLDNALDAVLVRASDGTVKYRSAATIISGNYWGLAGTSKLTGNFNMTRDLDTDLDVSMFRILQPASVASAPSRTDIYLGAGNGATTPVEWGNIIIGQNNAPGLIAVGEHQGSRNIMIGNDIADLWTTPGLDQIGTHNFFAGRLVANNSPETSFTVAIGYEAYSNLSIATPGAVGTDVAIGAYAMQGFTSTGTLLGDDDENVAIGVLALSDGFNFDTQGGGVTIAIGKEAAYGAGIEYYNILMGWRAGLDTSLGRGNIGIGARSLANMTGAIWGNIGTGHNTYNVGVGVHTLEYSTGNQNVAMGVNAFSGYGNGSPSVIGDYNIAIGANSAKIVTGDFNSFFGGYTGARANGVQNQVALVGDRNTFLGAGATFTDAQPTFSDSVFIGSDYAQTMASDTIYLGSPTQKTLFNGPNIGFTAADPFVTGIIDSTVTDIIKFVTTGVTIANMGINIQIGTDVGTLMTTGYGNIMIGQSIANTLVPTGDFSGGRNVMLGYDLFNDLSAGDDFTHNIVIGRHVGKGSVFANYSIIMGYEAFTNVTQSVDESITENIVLGLWAMESFTGVGASTYDDTDMVVIGTSALQSATGSSTGGSASIFLGKNAGAASNAFRSGNIIVGSSAGSSSEGAYNVISIGNSAGSSQTGVSTSQSSGHSNSIYIGTLAGAGAASSWKSVLIGSEAGAGTVTGEVNVGVGAWSLSNVTGTYNTALGGKAGLAASALIGDYNTFIGGNVTYNVSSLTFSNSIVIGSNFTQVMASNKIYLGSPTQTLVANAYGAGTVTGTSTYALTVDASGNIVEGALGTVASGLINEIPFNNGAGGFTTDPAFAYDVTNNTTYAVTNYASTATLDAHASFITGDDINVIGTGSGRFAWTAVFGDVHTFDNGNTFRTMSNGLIWGTGNTATIAAGAFGIFSTMLGGEANNITPDVSGNYAHSFIQGWLNTSSKSYQHITGIRGIITGIGAYVHSEGYTAAYIYADGDWAVSLGTTNTVAQTSTHGANAANSAIIGGEDSNIPSDSPRSVILGGQLLKMPAATPDTVLVQDLMVNGSLLNFSGTSLISLSVDDKDAAASVTTADFQTSGISITNTPSGFVQVLVNGIMVRSGDGIKTKDCYFSGDSGTTARAWSAVVATDTLYWVGSVAGFELAVTDKIDLNYI